MSRNLISDYVNRFGELINKPGKSNEVEQLLLSIPDPQTFEKVRNLFYQKFKNPLLTTFLNELSPDQHTRILNAYQRATNDYK